MLQAPRDLDIKYELPTFAYQPSPAYQRSSAGYQQSDGTPLTLLKQNMLGSSALPPAYHLENMAAKELAAKESAAKLDDYFNSTSFKLWRAASLISCGVCTYHGYKRNGTVGSAILWALAGGIFPVISVAIAAAQGFGKENEKK